MAERVLAPSDLEGKAKPDLGRSRGGNLEESTPRAKRAGPTAGGSGARSGICQCYPPAGVCALKVYHRM
jgi:hypothetical protein